MQYYIDRMADYGLCGVVATDGPVAASGPHNYSIRPAPKWQLK